MTVEEAITTALNIKTFLSFFVEPESKDLTAMDMAVAALRAQLEDEKNEPLSVETLRTMAGLPVWVQSPGVPEYGRWEIVEGVSEDGEALFLKNDFTCHEYGRVWLAYRRPPVKEDA